MSRRRALAAGVVVSAGGVAAAAAWLGGAARRNPVEGARVGLGGLRANPGVAGVRHGDMAAVNGDAVAVNATARSAAADPAAGRRVLRRLMPQHADAFVLTALPVSPGGGEEFRVDRAVGGAGRVAVAGSSTVALLAGVNWYLKYVAGVCVSVPGDSLARLDSPLPHPAPISVASSVPHRFALNDTENGYAGAYRTWAEWEREIDLLALHGFNQVLVTTGHDEVYRRTFSGFGYRPDEIDAWIPGPAHQPWWLLGNLSELAGPVDPDVRRGGVALTRQIVARLRELGMTAVLPGYYGMVPPGFAKRNHGAAVVAQGRWDGGGRPDWLDTRDPRFARLAQAFYAHQSELYGPPTAVKMDLFHEGGSAGRVPVGEAATAVMAALQTHCPGATWVMIGWEGNPRREVVDALLADGAGPVLIVDGCSDRFAAFDREADWGGAPYAFGAITNFGGRTTLGANAKTWTTRFAAKLAQPASALRGIAWMPEAFGHDPAAFELFAELGWRREAIDFDSWFAGYAARRYGGRDPHATAAWRTIAETAYALPPGSWSSAQDSPFSARPDLSRQAEPAIRYDTAAFQTAVGELLAVAPELRATDAYRYDLVDVTRQALDNRAWTVLQQIQQAYTARDAVSFRRLTSWWTTAMRHLDDLLATHGRFLVGTWLAPARSAALSASQAGRVQYDLRSVITTWGGRNLASGLHDYAERELAGLVRDLYLPRWQCYFATLSESLTGGAEPAPVDWFAIEDCWVRQVTGYPTTPRGDAHAAARRVWGLLAV